MIAHAWIRCLISNTRTTGKWMENYDNILTILIFENRAWQFTDAEKRWSITVSLPLSNERNVSVRWLIRPKTDRRLVTALTNVICNASGGISPQYQISEHSSTPTRRWTDFKPYNHWSSWCHLLSEDNYLPGCPRIDYTFSHHDL